VTRGAAVARERPQGRLGTQKNSIDMYEFAKETIYGRIVIH